MRPMSLLARLTEDFYRFDLRAEHGPSLESTNELAL